MKSFRDAYPDDNERHAFAQRVLVDFDSHNYHMYSVMYVPHSHASTSLLPTLMIVVNARHMVIGRRPEIPIAL